MFARRRFDGMRDLGSTLRRDDGKSLIMPDSIEERSAGDKVTRLKPFFETDDRLGVAQDPERIGFKIAAQKTTLRRYLTPSRRVCIRV